MKTIFTIAAIGIFFLLESCNQNRQNTENGTERNNLENSTEKSEREIFGRGEKLPKELVTGNAWHNKLVNEDSIYTTAVGVEKFEPGSRNVWHSHPAGQIIIVLDGVGYHQIKGQPAQILKKGDVAQCPPGVLHWHGASKNSGVTQMYILPNTEKGLANWSDKVEDDVYKNVEK